MGRLTAMVIKAGRWRWWEVEVVGGVKKKKERGVGKKAEREKPNSLAPFISF